MSTNTCNTQSTTNLRVCRSLFQVARSRRSSTKGKESVSATTLKSTSTSNNEPSTLLPTASPPLSSYRVLIRKSSVGVETSANGQRTQRDMSKTEKTAHDQRRHTVMFDRKRSKESVASTSQSMKANESHHTGERTDATLNIASKCPTHSSSTVARRCISCSTSTCPSHVHNALIDVC
jgi:hypothetical protein